MGCGGRSLGLRVSTPEVCFHSPCFFLLLFVYDTERVTCYVPAICTKSYRIDYHIYMITSLKSWYKTLTKCPGESLTDWFRVSLKPPGILSYDFSSSSDSDLITWLGNCCQIRENKRVMKLPTIPGKPS